MALIDKAEIAKHRNIATGISDAKINPYITAAEHQDIKPQLGDKFYFDLVAGQTETLYRNVLEPHTYTYRDQTYTHQGLKTVQSLYAYARYVISGSFIDTSVGMVQKNSQDSQSVSFQHKGVVSKDAKTEAAVYFQEIKDFLCRFPSLYDNYSDGLTRPRVGGFKSTRIG